MARFRRDVILDSLSLDFCSEEEKRKLEQLYSIKAKGPAVCFIMRRLRSVWTYMVNQNPQLLVEAAEKTRG